MHAFTTPNTEATSERTLSTTVERTPWATIGNSRRGDEQCGPLGGKQSVLLRAELLVYDD